MKVLVTGAAGFIGRHTVAVLEATGHEVIALDNDRDRLEDMDTQRFPALYDIRDAKLLDTIFERIRPEAVIHLAAQSSVAVSLRNPILDAQTNILGTFNIVQCCQKYGIKRIVFASSGGTVHGEAQRLPIVETDPLNPLSPYGVSKVAAESYIKISGISYVILRYGNVYGLGQDPNGESGVVAIFLGNLMCGHPCQIFGNGMNTRDYVYVSDIANANLIALETWTPGIFNISANIETSILEIRQCIEGILGYHIIGDIYQPERKGEVKRICLDNSKAKNILGWQPTISFEEGIRLTVEAMTDKLQSKEATHAI